MLTPTMHKPIPMNTRVKVAKEYVGYEATGTVVGIAQIHVIFQYIVLLDVPVTNEFGEQRAITVSGPQLDSEDGMFNWRLEPEQYGKYDCSPWVSP